MKTILAAALLLALTAPAAQAGEETWCLKSEHQAGPDAPTTYYYQRKSNLPEGKNCSKENRLVVQSGSFGRDAAIIGITVAKKTGE